MDTDKPYKFHKDETKRYPPKKWKEEINMMRMKGKEESMSESSKGMFIK
jgi:hypothetical protein